MSELRFEDLIIPGADLGPENPLPPLQRGTPRTPEAPYPGFSTEIMRNLAYGHPANYLPYTMQDRYGRRLTERPFKVAVLENEILRATFFLELGGRLRSLVHKPSGRELLECNPVFQPANLAIRNAWFSGGVEWNIGILGHHPFTCSPMFAGRGQTPDGTPVLRLWEWERLRQVPYQIDAFLPDGSPMLMVRVRITNPHESEVPMYWWSNTAVPESEETRVLVPADQAYSFGYGKSGPALLDIPMVQGTDVSYTTRHDKAVDFFFHIPDDRRRWVSALDGGGRGLVQTSTDLLKGRKLFLWGMNPGGRRWQEFLSVKGHQYLEIQAGLSRVQGEHLPMPAGAVWEWLEGYGLMEADPRLAHSSDWAAAWREVDARLEKLMPRQQLEAAFAATAAWVDAPPAEVLQHGSGWGALEQRRRQAAGQKPLAGPAIPFAAASMGPLQAPWCDLLTAGCLPEAEPRDEPTSYLVQPEWRERLEAAVAAGRGVHWYAWLHLGVMRYWAEDFAGARQAWEASLAARPNAWAARNLAVLAREEGRGVEAGNYYLQACRERLDVFPLAVECGQFLVDSGRAQDWLDLVGRELPEPVRSAGRIRLLEGQAALAVEDFARVDALLQEKLVIDDLREGERSLSHLWFAYHERRLSVQDKVAVDDALRERVRREYPVPEHLDFRMSND